MFSLFHGSVPVSDVVCKGDLSCIKGVSSESAEKSEVTLSEPCKEREVGYSDNVKRKRSVMANRAKRMRYNKNKHIKYRWTQKDAARRKKREVVTNCNEEEVIADNINTFIEHKPPVMNQLSDVSTTTPVKDATL